MIHAEFLISGDGVCGTSPSAQHILRLTTTEDSSFASQFLQWVDGESSKPIPPTSRPSPQTIVGCVDAPPCDTSVQKLFTSNALESDCGVLELEDIDNNSGGLVEKAPAHDKHVVKSKPFFVYVPFGFDFEMTVDLKILEFWNLKFCAV